MKVQEKVNRIIASYENRSKTKIASIVGYTKLGNNSAIVFVHSIKELDPSELKACVHSILDHKLTPVRDTYSLKHKSEDGYIYSIAVVNNKMGEVRSEDQVGDMVKLVGNSYVDRETGTIWERVKSSNGNRYLFVRKVEVDVDKILRDAVYASSNQTQRYIAGQKINEHYYYEKGDLVSFCYESENEVNVLQATVVNDKGDSLVLSYNGKTFSLPKYCIINKITSAKGQIDEEWIENKIKTIEEVVEFLKKVYPEKYAKVLERILTKKGGE